MSALEVNLRPPRVLLASAAGLGFAGACAMIFIATAQPSLGARFVSPKGDGAGVVVDYAANGSQLAKGDVLLSVAASGQPPIAVDRDTIVEDPDFLMSYAAREAFFVRQDALSRSLGASAVALRLADGRELHVKPHRRSLTSLPLVFWYQLLCGFIALLTAASMVSAGRDRFEIRLFGFTGLMFAFIAYTTAVYSTRELALPYKVFRWLAALEHFGSMAFIVGYISLMWNYPTRLPRFPILRVLGGTLAVVWVLDTWGRLPHPDWGIRLPMIGALAICCLLGFVQWRRTPRDPLGRATLRWFLISMLVGAGTFVFAVFVTVWVGQEPFISQGYALGFVLIIYLGIAIGATRHRLFELERWWASLWLWILAGASVALLDAAFAYVLHLDRAMAATLALLLGGWLYFPVRQWLLSRLLQKRELELFVILPRIVEMGLRGANSHAISTEWRGILKALFGALEVGDAPFKVSSARVTDDGLALVIPSVAGAPPTRIALAYGGSKLFTPVERNNAQVLVDLIGLTLEQRDAYATAAETERKRVARDLHDDLGSRLLTLVHRAGDGATGEVARDALRELRTVVETLGAGPERLDVLTANWRAEVAERLEAAGVTLLWTDAVEDRDIWVDSTTHTNVLRVLREALSNALRHGKPNVIEITLAMNAGMLSFDILDDGSASDPTLWKPGRGLANIRHRLQALGGTSTIAAKLGTGVHFRFEVPLLRREPS